MPMQATTTTPLFSAALRPDRTLQLAGGWIALALGAVAALPFMVVVPEVVVPASVALGTTGVGLAALGLRVSRQGRVAQQVTLWADQLEIVVTNAKGARTLKRFDPHAVRLLLRRDENEKPVTLALRTGSESFEIGDFLKPEDKASFARAFGTALRKARRR